MPYGHGVPWSTADKVVGLGWIEPDHWVCYEALIEEQTIMVYDSLSRSRSPDRVLNSFKHAKRNIATACRLAKLWEKRVPKESPKDEWDICVYKHPPQQGNSHNCGIFALKFLECIVSGHDVSILHASYMSDLRKQICASLYRVALQGDKGYKLSLV